MNEQFLADVASGLNAEPKYLLSKYFYDKRGDELFMQIMSLPEYYLTRAEMEIFSSQTQNIIDLLGVRKDIPFDLIELGAGDGRKTKMLLAALLKEGYDIEYVPVDISANVLEHLTNVLGRELPGLKIRSQASDYFKTLRKLKQRERSKIVLYLGSNLGNLTDAQARKFIYELGANLHKGDKFLLGVDQIKSADIVLPAYDDSQGVTRDFNLNLLHRINEELNGNFDLSQFRHIAEYREEEGVAKSFLQSLKVQEVRIRSLKQSFHFSAGEKIQMEISRKYNQAIIDNILDKTDFEVLGVLKDRQEYFADYVIERR